MALFVTLMKMTDQGIKDVEHAPDRVERMIADFEAAGGKVHGFWMTMGEYDYVTVTEGPSDEMGAAFLLKLGQMGTVRTLCMKAFDVPQMKEIVGSLSRAAVA